MKKNVPVIFFLAFALLAVIFVSGCNPTSDDSVPLLVPTTVTTNVIANVTSTTAQSGGYIVFNGGSSVTTNGVCWSTTNQNPTTSDSKKADSVVETNFISQLTGLSPQTTYYVRAYAITSYGTGYGSTIKFTTLASGATTPTGTVTTFAGSLTGGNQTGTGTGALFNNPQGIAADAQGNLYVADSYNNLIRKITPLGVVTTLAGSGTLGYTNATGTNAQFYAPQGIAVDATSGNVYVADFGNNAIRKITPTGVVTTLAGDGFPGYADGTGSGAVFKAPCGVVADGSGNVYVTDQGNNVVRKVTSAGVVTTLAGYSTGGFVDSTGVNAAFRAPSGITIDAAGANLYVSDQSNNCIREITIASSRVKTVISNLAQPKILNIPAGITTDAAGNIYFIDATGRVMELTAAKILYTLAGSANTAGFADGIGTAAQFNSPQSLAFYQGVLYVTDEYNNLIRKITIH